MLLLLFVPPCVAPFLLFCLSVAVSLSLSPYGCFSVSLLLSFLLCRCLYLPSRSDPPDLHDHGPLRRRCRVLAGHDRLHLHGEHHSIARDSSSRRGVTAVRRRGRGGCNGCEGGGEGTVPRPCVVYCLLPACGGGRNEDKNEERGYSSEYISDENGSCFLHG